MSQAWVAVVAASAAAGLAAPGHVPGVPRPARRPRGASSLSPEPRPSPARAVGVAGVGVATALLVGGVWGVPLGVLAAALAWRYLAGVEPGATRRRREELELRVPHAVELMALALAAGLSPEESLRRVVAVTDGALREELSTTAARLSLGGDPQAVWTDLAGHPQLGALGRAVSRAVDSGASVATALHRLAGDLRADQRTRIEGRARSVGVKAALPLGVCLLPAFVLIGIVPMVAGAIGRVIGG